MSKASSMIDKRYLDLVGMMTANIHQLPQEVLEFYLTNRDQIPDALERGFVLPTSDTQPVKTRKESTIPVLNQTGPVFADWLAAREELHKFFTGQVISFRDLFEIPDGVMIRNDIMPFFRPAGATNRMAMEWKKRLGMNECYEEVDIMKYSNSRGPQIPQLGFIARSVKPDPDTINKTPRQLEKVEMDGSHSWLGLFGYCDADNLHFLITGEHLDPQTWTWFVNDRLPGGGVAGGFWDPGNSQSKFRWYNPEGYGPCVGARLATFFSLKS